jgi:dihydroorotate dehydrogenase electron transfer subunit
MKDITFEVECLTPLNHRIFELRLRAQEELPPLHCGQFIHLRPIGGEPQLRRPFCLYKFDKNTITTAVAIVGKGTQRLRLLKEGDLVSGIVPLGNGFTLDNRHQNVALVGGGIGCAPLLAVPQCYAGRNYRAYLGFASKKDTAFVEEFSRVANTFVSTDDGSMGFKGYPHQLLESGIIDSGQATPVPMFVPDVILTCGPVPMLRAVAALAGRLGIPAFASLEQRMGCGVGACLVCVCAIKDANGVPHNLRVCADGPVFDLSFINS